LQAAATTWASISIVPRYVLGVGQTPPSEKISIAGVGVGGVGFGQLQSCAETNHIYALCDVDDAYAKKAHDKWPAAKRYRDYREMLDAEGSKIDAVYIGTPDHTHALITLAALKKKKHVCCVKPLTRTIEELRVVVAAAQKAGVATQMTAAPNTSEVACRVCELIWAGAIGAVREVHVWSDRPLWPQGMMRPAGQDAVPSTFDWKMWLGPASARPFKAEWADNDYALKQVNMAGGGAPWYKSVYHPFNFRGWWDFGSGALGDMGCHHLNHVFRAMKLKYPTAVQATSTKVTAEAAPLASIVTWEFPARENMPPVRVIWYDGGLKPPCPKELEGKALPAEGQLYIGDEGKMLGPTILPVSRGKKFADIPRTLPRRGGTWLEWFEACKGGQRAGCDFEWSGPLTETVLLGNVAIRAGKRIEWDAQQMRVTNDEEANRFVKAAYQNGWSLNEA
jgi:predicted dehydrogenase